MWRRTFITAMKNVIEKRNSKDHSANKIDHYNRRKRRLKKKKENPKRTKSKCKNSKYFSWVTAVSDLSLSGSHSPHFLPRMPSNAALVCGPAVWAAYIFIWFYSCVFLPPVSTAVRTSAFFFFFWTLSVSFYIYHIYRVCLVDPVDLICSLYS